MNSPAFRIERDSMGELQVPTQALWGAQTQRAVENFPISGYRLPRAFIRALALIKQAAAATNLPVGTTRRRVGGAHRTARRRRSRAARTMRSSRSTYFKPAPAPAAT